MHNMQVKMLFVKLKAEGMPMYKIAKAIGVHRTTLTLWHKELAEFILIARQDHVDELLYENNNTRLSRIEFISRHINTLYEMLDNPWQLKKTGMKYDEVLTIITKYTKLLHMEYNEKPLQRLIKNADREKMNNENSEIKEAPVWITDMEAFREVQPEENNPEEIEIDYEEPDELDIYEKMEGARDISEEDPEIQKIFKRTRTRTLVGEKREAYLKEAEEYYKSIKGEEKGKRE
ncbi:MAG: helix-turn-helix domain-containing protein [Bacteroidetes bacterium]|nr:helix-turn-helix domain-containing protein [Bacteroidota bacterium]